MLNPLVQFYFTCVPEKINNHQIPFLSNTLLPSLQADHSGCLHPFSGRDAGLRLHPEPGSPLGGLYHCRSFRVGYDSPTDTVIVTKITGRC